MRLKRMINGFQFTFVSAVLVPPPYGVEERL